jgi:hypothetical protein
MQGEDGASLIIALAFLLLFSLILVAILAFAVTSFGAGGDVSDRVSAQYAANAAVDTAVQRIRSDATMQLGSSTWDTSNACNLTYNPTDGTPSASATCNPTTNDDGDPTGTVRPGMNGFPANAILATGSGGITATGSGSPGPKLKANANVYSDGGITLNNGATLDAYDNAITARGACTPTVPGSQWVTVQTACDVTASAPQYADGSVPNWNSQITSGTMPLNKGPAACATTNGIATFSSGYWTDPKKLTDLPGGCRAGVYYFSPGVYYFNFSNLHGDRPWRINGIVVGGTPLTSWYADGAVPPTPGANATEPVACNPSAPGVQFVLGGSSQIRLAPPTSTSVSSLELCPNTDAQGNRIAIFGSADCATCNTEPIVTVLNPSSFRPTPNYSDFPVPSACVQGTYNNVNTPAWCTLPQPPPPTSGPTSSAVDGLYSQALNASGGGGNASRSITFTDFDWSANGLGTPDDQQPDIPPGLRIQSVGVIVRHREPAAGETPTITVGALTQAGNNKTCTATPTPSSAGAWQYDGYATASNPTPPNPPAAWTPPGTDGGLTTTAVPCTSNASGLIGQVSWTRGNGQNAQDFAKSLEVEYRVSGNNGTLNSNPPELDGLQIVATLVPEVVPQNGCVTGSSGNPCSFLSNDAFEAGHAGIWGTVYTKDAFLGVSSNSFDFGGATNIVFNRGVIVASLDVTGLPTNDNKGRFRLADGTGRTVDLVSTSGPARVRARVRVVDSATAPIRGFLAVIRKWSTAKP